MFAFECVENGVSAAGDAGTGGGMKKKVMEPWDKPVLKLLAGTEGSPYGDSI